MAVAATPFSTAAGIAVFLLFVADGVLAGRGQPHDVVEHPDEPQKNYEEDEDGKIVPHRTFLTDVEIALICVFSILFFFALVFLCIWVCLYGWVLPNCCKRNQDSEYQKVQQLHRERKIGEIWTRRNYQTSEAQRI